MRRTDKYTDKYTEYIRNVLSELVHRFDILLLVLWFCLLFGVSAKLFAGGFFLTKQAVPYNNTCSNHSQPLPLWAPQYNYSTRCWSHQEKVYRRLVVLLVDALRYDFASGEGSNPHYSGKLTILESIARTKPSQSLLLRFRADPPTTTFQRLKALTTGGMPTFVDASSNFDTSGSIQEDNVIDQFRMAGKRMTFMGDDTWMVLYPHQFNHQYPHPSFNVKDIHSGMPGFLK